MPTDAIPQLLDISTLAELLSINVRHVRRLIQERRIPFIKVGRLIRFDPNEIQQWLDGNRCREGRGSRQIVRSIAPAPQVLSGPRRRPAETAPPSTSPKVQQLLLDS